MCILTIFFKSLFSNIPKSVLTVFKNSNILLRKESYIDHLFNTTYNFFSKYRAIIFVFIKNLFRITDHEISSVDWAIILDLVLNNKINYSHYIHDSGKIVDLACKIDYLNLELTPKHVPYLKVLKKIQRGSDDEKVKDKIFYCFETLPERTLNEL